MFFPNCGNGGVDTPVMLPPEWARLETKPIAIGSPVATTIGIVLVARFSASETMYCA
jgi:hypothetical protein